MHGVLRISGSKRAAETKDNGLQRQNSSTMRRTHTLCRIYGNQVGMGYNRDLRSESNIGIFHYLIKRLPTIEF